MGWQTFDCKKKKDALPATGLRDGALSLLDTTNILHARGMLWRLAPAINLKNAHFSMESSINWLAPENVIGAAALGGGANV